MDLGWRIEGRRGLPTIASRNSITFYGTNRYSNAEGVSRKCLDLLMHSATFQGHLLDIPSILDIYHI